MRPGLKILRFVLFAAIFLDLTTSLSLVCLSVLLSFHPSVHLPICRSVYLSYYLSIYLSPWLFCNVWSIADTVWSNFAPKKDGTVRMNVCKLNAISFIF